MTPRIFLYGKTSHVVHDVVRDQRRYTGTRHVVVHLPLVRDAPGSGPVFPALGIVGKGNARVAEVQVPGMSAVQLFPPFVVLLPLVVLECILHGYFRSIRQMIRSSGITDVLSYGLL